MLRTVTIASVPSSRGQAQHAGFGAEGGERLLWPKHGEQVASALAVQRRTGPDVAFGIGEQSHATIAGRGLGQARGERGLPVEARAQRLVLEVEGGDVGVERQ